jgi:hypothetical protein
MTAPRIRLPLDDGHQLTHRAVSDYLRIYLVASFEHSENRCFAPCPATAYATYPPRPKIPFVKFDFAVDKRTVRFENLDYPLTKMP